MHPVALRRPNGQPCAAATYRFQFNRTFNLACGLRLIPYLKRLGVTHVYASPLLQASSGSTHGYDVCDPSQLNPEVGAEEQLQDFAERLHAEGMGMVLDIVPNHMGIGPENPWWWDVLTRGRASRYAEYFDIDWESPDPDLRGKVAAPVLGDPLPEVLARGELRVEEQKGHFVVAYYNHRYPLDPATLPREKKTRAQFVAGLNRNPAALAALLEKQHYRLLPGREGDARLNYRRFFAVSTLAALRVEAPKVFKTTHDLILRWYKLGIVNGLRVDHPDGLRDPLGYLSQLRQNAPGAWIVVEKITLPGEDLASDWPVAGTTGYDFLNRVNELMTDAAGKGALTSFYTEFTGEPIEWPEIVHAKKLLVLADLLKTEVNRLVRRLEAIAPHRQGPAPAEQLRAALLEIIAAFPVYRTYGRRQQETDGQKIGIHYNASDLRYLAAAVDAATSRRPDLKDAAKFIHEILRQAQDEAEVEFVLRFQQLTGPAMAKGSEDTACYCFNRYVSLNEVGGDPGRFGASLTEFHRGCADMQRAWPATMLTTSTHDTKRSEDVRARLNVLSEIPQEWCAAVRRWAALNERHRRGGFPDRNAEYLYYQTLVGAWPLPLERALAYMEKATCEAGQHTQWSHRNRAYDEALQHFVKATLSDGDFLADFEKFLQPVREMGWLNSLTQTLIKLTAPGVPDIYQGTELWDLSLVDPDNRRGVDFAVREKLLAELTGMSVAKIMARLAEGLPKLWVIRQTLALRGKQPGWFGEAGAYEPMEARGAKAEHVVAFSRGGGAVTVAPRFFMRLGGNWQGTTLPLPPGTWENQFTAEKFAGGERPLAELLRHFPVALLAKTEG